MSTDTGTGTTIDYTARLAPPNGMPQGRIEHRSWFVTFGLGKPAGGTSTEVVVPDCTDDGRPLTRDEKRQLVRRVVTDLYGTAWAFEYAPEDAEQAVFRYGLRIREHVTVTSVEVWS